MQPLPLYGLASPFDGERWIEGEGRDQRTIVHRPTRMQKTLTVGVDRRTSGNGQETGRAEYPTRLDMATALVVDLPGVGDDVFDVAAEVARDDAAWRECRIKVDEQALAGCEREYEGVWIAYCLTTTLILYVLAPLALRPDLIELKKLESKEVLPHGRS